MEVTLTQPRTYLEIQLNSEEIPEQTTEQEQEKSLKTLHTQKNQLEHNLPTPVQQKTRGGGQTDPHIPSCWEGPTKKRPNNIKTQIHTESQHKWKPKTSEHRRSRTLHHWMSQIFYHRSSHHKPRESEQITRRVSQTMGRQRNNPQIKGKKKAPERILNEIQASQLSGIEFKAMVIEKLNELTENYQKLQGN